tara:strand:+ start:250 stop:756 length:507 start_codon:yes stop_codon:yes gene_type:complete
MTRRFTKFYAAIAVSFLVAACGYELKVVDTNAINPEDSKAFQQELKSYSMVSGGNVQTIPTLTAVGYAVVSTQPGKSDAQRRLMAIRAARMAAIRELAEQIHGLQVDSNTTVVDLMVQNDTFRGVVTGIIRGARTVRINPTGSDTYEIVLEIDRDVIARLIQAADRYT